jgi:hypothetical protein
VLLALNVTCRYLDYSVTKSKNLNKRLYSSVCSKKIKNVLLSDPSDRYSVLCHCILIVFSERLRPWTINSVHSARISGSSRASNSPTAHFVLHVFPFRWSVTSLTSTIYTRTNRVHVSFVYSLEIGVVCCAVFPYLPDDLLLALSAYIEVLLQDKSHTTLTRRCSSAVNTASELRDRETSSSVVIIDSLTSSFH